jgi:hypothetical protein
MFKNLSLFSYFFVLALNGVQAFAGGSEFSVHAAGLPQTPACAFSTHFVDAQDASRVSRWDNRANHFFATLTGSGMDDCQACAMAACLEDNQFSSCTYTNLGSALVSANKYCSVAGVNKKAPGQKDYRRFQNYQCRALSRQTPFGQRLNLEMTDDVTLKIYAKIGEASPSTVIAEKSYSRKEDREYKILNLDSKILNVAFISDGLAQRKSHGSIHFRLKDSNNRNSSYFCEGY